jgi:hypothetical protein
LDSSPFLSPFLSRCVSLRAATMLLSSIGAMTSLVLIVVSLHGTSLTWAAGTGRLAVAISVPRGSIEVTVVRFFDISTAAEFVADRRSHEPFPSGESWVLRRGYKEWVSDARGGTLASWVVFIVFPAWFLLLVSLLWPLGACMIGWIRRVQRSSRRKHHQCVRCGYDLRGSPGPRCPECGSENGDRNV